MEEKFCCGGEFCSGDSFFFMLTLGRIHQARKFACAYALTGIALWGNNGKLSLNIDLLKVLKGTLSLQNNENFAQ